jgi:hypothetical protein
MRPSEAMEQERMAFLYELYTRSAGDARHGVPYEELIDALGCGEALTERFQCELQHSPVTCVCLECPQVMIHRADIVYVQNFSDSSGKPVRNDLPEGGQEGIA